MHSSMIFPPNCFRMSSSKDLAATPVEVEIDCKGVSEREQDKFEELENVEQTTGWRSVKRRARFNAPTGSPGRSWQGPAPRKAGDSAKAGAGGEGGVGLWGKG